MTDTTDRSTRRSAPHATAPATAAGARDGSSASRPLAPTVDAAARAALDRPVLPLRHPVRWIAAAVVLVLLLNGVETLFTNPAWGGPRSGSGCSAPRS